MTFAEAVTALSQAIAHAEGFYVRGSLPARVNNPGDLELGDHGHGTANKKTIYATAESGWLALEAECTLILSGRSHYIKPFMNFNRFAMIYTGNDHPTTWANAVTQKLGKLPGDTLASLITEPPQ